MTICCDKAMNYKGNCNNLSNPKQGYISVLNYGGFLTRFNGTYVMNEQVIKFAVNEFAIGQERRFTFPVGASQISVNIEYAIFIDTWGIICSRYYPVSDEICFVTYGLTVNPKCVDIPCPSPGILKDIFPGGGVFIPNEQFNLMLANGPNACNQQLYCNNNCFNNRGNSMSSNNICSFTSNNKV